MLNISLTEYHTHLNFSIAFVVLIVRIVIQKHQIKILYQSKIRLNVNLVLRQIQNVHNKTT